MRRRRVRPAAGIASASGIRHLLDQFVAAAQACRASATIRCPFVDRGTSDVCTAPLHIFRRGRFMPHSPGLRAARAARSRAASLAAVALRAGIATALRADAAPRPHRHPRRKQVGCHADGTAENRCKTRNWSRSRERQSRGRALHRVALRRIQARQERCQIRQLARPRACRSASCSAAAGDQGLGRGRRRA